MVDTPEDTFVVKRISYRYTYSAGRYRMTGKGASVVKAGRLGIEKALGRLLPTPGTSTCAALSGHSSSQKGRRSAQPVYQEKLFSCLYCSFQYSCRPNCGGRIAIVVH